MLVYITALAEMYITGNFKFSSSAQTFSNVRKKKLGSFQSPPPPPPPTKSKRVNTTQTGYKRGAQKFFVYQKMIVVQMDWAEDKKFFSPSYVEIIE